MSAASSPMASSPQPDVAKASRVCLNCKRKKKRCDKALPRCGRCVDSSQECIHEDDIFTGATTPVYSLFPGVPSPIGSVGQIPRQSPQTWGGMRQSLVASIQSADDIDSLALQSICDILESRQGAEHAVSAYFEGPHTVLAIIERVSFEIAFEDMWKSPSAETSVLVLCMSLLAQSPTHTSSNYHTVKALLSLVQCSLQMSIPLMQAELLMAQYEFSQTLQQQAYLSIGRCVHMSRIFGWHNTSYWSVERQASNPKALKLHSILWWSIVFLDGQLNVAYHEPKYPPHTSSLSLDIEIPRPEAFDQYLPLPLGGFLDANSNQVEGMLFPEANSALYLNTTLQQLSNPLLAYTPDQRENFSQTIWNHTVEMANGPWSTGDRSAAVGTNFITVLKLNQPGLLAATGMGSMPRLGHGPTFSAPVKRIRDIIELIHSEAANPTRFLEKLALGRIAPCWAFAMYYASLLLISHGESVLRDRAWLHKVGNLRGLLEAVAGKWKIAERYVYSLDQALQRRHMSGYVA